jgi:hypothetical protein
MPAVCATQHSTKCLQRFKLDICKSIQQSPVSTYVRHEMCFTGHDITDIATRIVQGHKSSGRHHNWEMCLRRTWMATS